MDKYNLIKKKAMKKTRFIIAIFLLLFTFASCGREQIIGNLDAEPLMEPSLVAMNPEDALKLTELDERYYNNFTVYTEKSVYTGEEDRIVFTIQNNNPGKKFYYYDKVTIEKNIRGEWVRYLCNDVNISGATCLNGTWMHSTKLGENQLYTGQASFKPIYVTPELDDGKYRAVIFIPEDETGMTVQKIYCEFEIDN